MAASQTISYNSTNSKQCAQDGVGTYAGAHDATTSTVYTLASGTNNILHNSVIGGTYYVRRADLQFDTTGIPTDATITSAVLRMKSTSTGGSNVDGDTVVALDNTNNANLDTTLASEDMDDFTTSSIGSTALSSYTNTNTDVDLTLTSYAVINKGGTTRIGLRLQNDINNTTPTGSNVLRIDTSSKCELILGWTLDDVKNSSLATNLVSYWELEEASGTRVDSHGSNDLSDNATVLQGTGIQGNCADLSDSTSEYLSFASSSTFVYDGASARSLSFWFYPHSVTGVNTVVSCWGGGSTQNWIVYTNGSNIVAGVESNGALITATSAATINAWHHVVLLMKASGSAELYVNGVSKGTGTPAGSAGANAPFYIGQNSSSNYYDGLVDEVGWWTTELSSGDVASLYNSGSGIPYDAGGAATFTPKVIMF